MWEKKERRLLGAPSSLANLKIHSSMNSHTCLIAVLPSSS